MPDLYVDADACPVKDEVVRVAERYGLSVFMVSNQGVRKSLGPSVKNIMVGAEFDAADNWIAAHVKQSDVVVTADIQLAARCLKLSASVLGPAGDIFSQQNIGSALAMRELNAYLREAGTIKGHNASFTKQDRSKFLQSLDAIIQKTLR